MKKRLKRILTIIMSVTLVLSGVYVGGNTVKAAASEMSVDSVLNFSTDNGDWRFNFNMNGTWPTTGAFETYTNSNLTVTIRNAAGEELAAVTTGALESYKNGPYWLLCVWGVYTGSNAPVQGDTLTISSGQLLCQSDTSKIVNFAKELVLKYDGTSWNVCVEQTVQDMSVDSVLNFSTDSGDWRFNFNMNGTWPTTGEFEPYVITDLTATIRNKAGEELATATTGTLDCYKNGPYWLLCVWGVYTGSNAPVQGDTLTISKGQMAYQSDSSKIVSFAEELVLEYDGTNWGIYEEPVEYNYADMQLVWGNYPSNQPNKENGYWDLYIETSADIPGTAWTTSYADIKVMVGEQEVAAMIKKVDQKLLNIFIQDEEVLPVTAPVGTEITIKAGQSLGSDLETQGINLTTDFTMVLSGEGVLVEKGTEIEYVDITPIRIAREICIFEPTLSRWNIYVNIQGTMPGEPWQGYFGPMEYTINGVSYQAMDVYHAGTYGLFFYIPESVLASDFTGNKTIVLKCGYGMSSVTGERGIYLTKDLTIYANEYGWSSEAFVTPLKVSQTNALLTLDTSTVFGGNENGIYLNTDDTFLVDGTWTTKIRALASDADSGVYYNGNKVNAPLVRYMDGKAYVGLADVGITAKDKDKVTIKGVFESNGYGVSYKEVSFYYNGKIWGTAYETAKAESYTKLKVESVHNVSAWNRDAQRWDVYLEVDNMIPGEIDKMQFSSLIVEIGGKEVETVVYHSYQDTLFFPIEKQHLSENCADGTKITVKAGKALAGDKSTGIELVKDFTFYTYKGSFSNTEPTNNTSWQSVSIIGMNTTAAYKKDTNSWIIHLKLKEKLETEQGTNYLKLPITILGKNYEITASRDGDFLMLTIPADILPGNAKNGVLILAAGAKGYANGGRDGIEIAEDFTMHLFNGVISEQEFTEIQEYEGRILGVQNALEDGDLFHVYLRLNKEFPGTEWYEVYDDFVYYYNGKRIETSARKSTSSNNKFMYFGIDKRIVGTPKDGDIVEILGGTVMSCGGYRMTITEDFWLMYEDGLWSQYVETDVKAPEDTKSLWEIARFDSEYIPTTENGSVLYSNEDVYNKISSIEPMKDFTISFNAKKFFDDETTPTFGVILRGNAISEDEEMTYNLLNGYVITFSSLEEVNENDESTWTGFINLWKNGENYSLLDQYRISYVHDKNDHPYFQTDVDYNYEFSIYNITETCVCITVKVNGKLAMRYYDEAGSDPFDPAINEGTFQVFAGCPNYITDDIVELKAVISEKDECQVGDKVRVAATYPSVLEGAEFQIEQEGATITDGIFVAEKPGTYTIKATYKGKELVAKTITVTEAEVADGVAARQLPIVPIVLGFIAVVMAGTLVTFVFIKRKRREI